MNIEHKKIIAREILIGSSCLGIIIIFIVGLWLYDSYYNSRSKAILGRINEVQEAIDSVAQVTRAELQKDTKPGDFDFSDVLEPPPPKKYAVELRSLKNEYDLIRRNRLSSEDFSQAIVIVSIVIFALVYPLRIFILTIRWSLKTIKKT